MSWCQQAKAVGKVHPADPNRKKQRAPNGDKNPGTEQWKFAQRHPVLLSASAGVNEFAGPVQTNLATYLFLPGS